LVGSITEHCSGSLVHGCRLRESYQGATHAPVAVAGFHRSAPHRADVHVVCRGAACREDSHAEYSTCELPGYSAGYRVTPQIPQEAVNASVTVVLHAVIDASGRARQLEYVSGPPPLAQAAIDAVKWWQYRVDGEGEEIDTIIEVPFPPGDNQENT
jgi:hypothetical protein